MYARTIGLIIAVIFYCAYMFPIPTITIAIVIIFSYLTYTYYTRTHIIDEGKIRRRKQALEIAKAFLNNYNDIWQYLRLSNQYCSLSLTNVETIIAIEKKAEGEPYRSFKIIATKVHPWEEVWNLFCINFSHNKSYDGLLEDCRRYKLVIEETINQVPNKILKNGEKTEPEVKQVVDINNCTEEELTNLPGISVIMAKKVIKKREEIYGFKNVQEFFTFLKLKEHQQEQLINLVCANQITYLTKIEKYDERSVDL